MKEKIGVEIEKKYIIAMPIPSEISVMDSYTVSEISYSVGINDPLYFSKLFKKIYGMSPKEYRAVYQSKK